MSREIDYARYAQGQTGKTRGRIDFVLTNIRDFSFIFSTTHLLFNGPSRPKNSDLSRFRGAGRADCVPALAVFD